MTRMDVRSSLAGHEMLRVGQLHAVHADVHRLTAHPHAVIALVLRGHATVWCGATYELQFGDVLIIPEGAPHATHRAREFELRGLAVCTSCLQTGHGRELMKLVHQVSEGACAVRRFSTEDARQFDWLLTTLGAEVEGRRPDWESAIEALFALMRVTLARAGLPEDVPVPSIAWVGRALAFIALHATDGISLADVAAYVERAPAHVAATVRAQTGRTVIAWIADARLAAARQWLLHTDASVEQLAAAVGYPSTSQFYRLFRRVHGMTPGDWRRLHCASEGDAVR